MEIQNTRTSEARPKRIEETKHVQNLENTQGSHLSPTFFRHYATFEIFWIAPKGHPSFLSIFCNTMDVKKSQRVPIFTFFGTVTLFKNHFFQKFFGKFFKVTKGSPFNFFSYFATSFTEPEGSPLSQF